MDNTLGQSYVFLGSIYGGILVGVLYDCLRLIRLALRPRKALETLLDLVFWIAAAFVFFFVMLSMNDAQLRPFELLGALLGAGLYLAGPSKLVMRGFEQIFISFGNTIRKAARGTSKRIKASREKRSLAHSQRMEQGDTKDETEAEP